MSNKTRAILNALSVLLVLAVNYYSQAFGIHGNSIGELSNRYANLFTPAGYAFSIWGVIFLGLSVSAVLQVKDAFFAKVAPEYLPQMGPWFALANLLNATWVFVWLHELTGLSVFVMLGILFSLLMITFRTNMERLDAPPTVMIRLWWPICLYFGWIAVATIANVSAFLAKLGWKGEPLTEATWTVILILLATGLNIFMILTRNMREFALVGIWALVAIHVRHLGSIDTIAWPAMGGAMLIGAVSSWHAWKNRNTNPLKRWLTGTPS